MDKLTRLGPAFIKGKPAGSWASIVLEQVEDFVFMLVIYRK